MVLCNCKVKKRFVQSLRSADIIYDMNLSKKILSDPVTNWVFSNFSRDTYLVGGYLRDLLRGRKSNDRDFTLKGDIRRIALDAARKFKGTFIELKKDLTCRVALRDREFIDFTRLQDDILQDLQQRDFTVNALAWSPQTGLIDPLKGEADLKNRTIRVVNPDNLVRDPLRMLRAYRLAAELGFSIDTGTRASLCRYAELTVSVSPERITEELFRLLNNSRAADFLSMCTEDKVLDKILGANSLILKDKIKICRNFDIMVQRFKRENERKILRMLNENLGQGLLRAGFIRLAILLGNGSISNNLILSRSNRRKLIRMQGIYKFMGLRLTGKRLYQIFMAAEGSTYEAAVILSLHKRTRLDVLLNRAEHFVKIKNKCLLTGTEIQKIFNIGPGEHVGEIKDELLEKTFLGDIGSKAEARSWILSNFT